MSPRARLLAVLALFLAAALSLLLSRGVWAPDEARYARVAQEMKAQGAWLVPSLNGYLYTQKPFLLFDLTQVASLGSDGIPDWGVKVPVLVAALLALLGVAWLGRRLLGPEGLWLAPLLLASQFRFLWQAQFGQIDMLVIAAVVGQIALGHAVALGEVRRLPGLAGLAVLGALGVFAKGPVGCLPAWLVLLAYFAATRDWSALRRLGLQWVVPAVLLLAGLWLLAGGLAAGWDYPKALVFKQTVTRYLEPWHHVEPWHYYLKIFWVDGLPWTLLVIPSIAPLIRKRGWREPGALLPLLWMAVYFLVFSVSSGKRSVYILPLYPALALLVAHGILKWQEKAWGTRGLQGALLFLAGLFAALLGTALWAAPAQAKAFVPLILPGFGALVLAAAAAAWFAWVGRAKSAAVALAGGVFLFFILSGVPVVRRLDPVKSPRAFAAAARPHLAAGVPLALFPAIVPSVNYYCDANTEVLGEKAQAEAFLQAGGPRMLLIQRDAWEGALPKEAAVLHLGPIGDGQYALVGVGVGAPPRTKDEGRGTGPGS